MNLQALINPQLWLAISNTYETGNYSHAILDAMHHLSDVLREKSGLDGDGAPLVGAALGGQSPVLRVNKLQTETERNIQKGLEQILRGMYQAIRNPRSHEQIEDDKDTADSIIYFANYLLSILEESQEPFTIPGFLDRVFDKHFVQSARYAELLVAEIPIGKRLDVLIEIYRRKQEGNGSNLQYVVKELLKQLPEDQTAQFLVVASEELKVTQDEIDIRLTLQVLPPSLWPGLSEASRLRAENILIKSIQEGQSSADGKTIKGAGALGTWARDFLQYFDLKSQVSETILDKLGQSESEQWYVFNFFLGVLPSLYGTSYRKRLCIEAIIEAVKSEFGDGLAQRLRNHYWSFPDDWKRPLDEAFPDLIQEEEIPF
jgi:uncharacterized protein (TIGR02391 family)